MEEPGKKIKIIWIWKNFVLLDSNQENQTFWAGRWEETQGSNDPILIKFSCYWNINKWISLISYVTALSHFRASVRHFCLYLFNNQGKLTLEPNFLLNGVGHESTNKLLKISFTLKPKTLLSSIDGWRFCWIIS